MNHESTLEALIIFDASKKERDNGKAAGIVVIWLGKNPNSSRVWPFLGVVHHSSKDARLSEAVATIIGSNRGYRQAASSEEVDAESRDVRWWKGIQE
ncbi:hypothetical protein Tco_1360529 [Tanacetum coccineum]